MQDDETSVAEAEAQDYNSINSDNDTDFCKKRSTFCHIVGALLLSAAIIGTATLGIWYFG